MERDQQTGITNEGRERPIEFKAEVNGLQYDGKEVGKKVRCPRGEVVTVFATTGRTGSRARVECPRGAGYCDAFFAEQTVGDPYITDQNLTVEVKAECNPDGYID